jgi:His-Xaa-Ser system radical SAM maturase HxsC
MSQKLTFRGVCRGLARRTLARISFTAVAECDRSNYFLAITKNSNLRDDITLNGYAAVLTERSAVSKIPSDFSGPLVRYEEDLSFISNDSILGINVDGHTRILFRPESPNNTIFATVECNSNCLMCSQPPVLSKDENIVDEHLRLIELIKDPPDSIGITGGEPTLLKDGLVAILSRLKDRFPNTIVHMLTNGRLYAYEDLVARIASVEHPHFTSAIPLYSDVASEHDYIVQAQGAFDETVIGLYNAAKHGLRIEIRVVLHKQTLPRLKQLADFIYRNLPFVDHIALMGLENMGYVRANWGLLWEDPVDYAPILEDAVRYFFYRRMNVSVYNLQLCVLPRSIWGFARQSISDFKNIYLDECGRCDVRGRCAGLFQSSEARHSRGIKAIHLESPLPQVASYLSCVT